MRPSGAQEAEPGNSWRPGPGEPRSLIGWPMAVLGRHWLRRLSRGSVKAGPSLNIAGDVRTRDRDLVRLLPWIIEADFEDRRPELWRRPAVAR